jgi:small-conductance mechanosensitive channel
MFLKPIIIFFIFSIIAAALWLANLQYQDIELDKFFYTATAISISYLIFRVLLEGIVTKRIKDSKTRYSFRKTAHILFLIISFIIILRIWIINPQALLVAYGLIAAGVAISLQDLFKNFAGGITILLTGLYHVGNRIEINGKFGDVIDISIFYTTILEIREWVDGDQATGRLSMIPNGAVLSGIINNYSKDHHFLWDEVSFPITYDSDWKKTALIMKSIANKEAGQYAKEAAQSISHLEERYYVSGRTTDPSVFFEATDNWIKLTLRYVVEVRERRLLRSKLTELILEEIENNPSIHIASETMAITKIPEINLKKNA